MPRYVILEHDHPVLHWDLMLEADGVLHTWRLAQPPTPGSAIDAIALGDHRLAYLDYQGPVGGNRGNVKRWDAGVYEDLPTSEGRKLDVQGQRIHGIVQLDRIDGERWRFLLLMGKRCPRLGLGAR